MNGKHTHLFNPAARASTPRPLAISSRWLRTPSNACSNGYPAMISPSLATAFCRMVETDVLLIEDCIGRDPGRHELTFHALRQTRL